MHSLSLSPRASDCDPRGGGFICLIPWLCGLVWCAQVDEWFKNYHDYPSPVGPACCAADSISFHYVGPTEALVLYDIITRPGRCVRKDPLC